MKEVDYIIVGQGLAGSVLAQQLLSKKKQIVVVDEEKENTSSKIAAGMCNPIVFKRLTKSWMIDKVLKKAKDFYQLQEELLNDHFYFDVPIYKLFADKEEQDFWRQKSNEPELFDWLNATLEHPFNEQHVNYSNGASRVLQSGFLQTEKWLNAYRSFLMKKECFLPSLFSYEDIVFKDNRVYWKDYCAQKIIFCEGYQSINNPYFKWLPFKLTKGEVLTVTFKNLQLNAAINKGVFVLPYNSSYKLGATYNWDSLDEEPTNEGKEELIAKAKKFITDTVEVIDHRAGIRPTVKDRRPLLGIHHDYPELAVFNGLGTKGVMLAPHFAEKMVDLLENKTPLPLEVDINRFSGKEV